MTVIPSTGIFDVDESLTQDEFRLALENLTDIFRESPGASAPVSMIISSGTIDPTVAMHSIDTEAAAATDDLTNIGLTVHPEGRHLFIVAENATHHVVVKHNSGGVGEILLLNGKDITLSNQDQVMWLRRSGNVWREVITTGYPDDITISSVPAFVYTANWANFAGVPIAMRQDYMGETRLEGACAKGIAATGAVETIGTIPVGYRTSLLVHKYPVSVAFAGSGTLIDAVSVTSAGLLRFDNDNGLAELITFINLAPLFWRSTQ